MQPELSVSLRWISTVKRCSRNVGILDYILDTKSFSCYAFFMLFFLTPAATFLMCLTTFGWNRCFINSSLVMSLGCFFFFMVAR